MSIINEALKKTQEHRSIDRLATIDDSKSVRHDVSWLKIGSILTISLLLVLLLAYWLGARHVFTPMHGMAGKIDGDAAKLALGNQSRKIAKHQASVNYLTDVDGNKLVLNGVLISHHQKVALINNHYFQLGDNINNLKIIGISDEGVKLQNGDERILLRSAS